MVQRCNYYPIAAPPSMCFPPSNGVNTLKSLAISRQAAQASFPKPTKLPRPSDLLSPDQAELSSEEKGEKKCLCRPFSLVWTRSFD